MKLAIVAAVCCALGLAACSSSDKSSATNQNDLGTGANTVKRQYAKSASDTWSAAESAAKASDFTIDKNPHDSMGGEIQAHRANGDRVTIRVRALDDKNSEAAVRVEPGNRNMAEIVHEKIAEKLGLKEAKAAWFGGNSSEGTYPKNIDECVKAAEEAAGRLHLTVTGREVKDGSATVDARESNSTPVQFKMSKVSDGTKVVFIAGKEKSEANRDLSARMKKEFENCCTARSN